MRKGYLQMINTVMLDVLKKLCDNEENEYDLMLFLGVILHQKFQNLCKMKTVRVRRISIQLNIYWRHHFIHQLIRFLIHSGDFVQKTWMNMKRFIQMDLYISSINIPFIQNMTTKIFVMFIGYITIVGI